MSHERLRGLSLVERERRRQAAVGIDLREQVVGLLLNGLDRFRARNPAQRRLLLVDDGHKSLRELRGVAALLAAHCLPGGPRLGGALGVVGGSTARRRPLTPFRAGRSGRTPAPRSWCGCRTARPRTAATPSIPRARTSTRSRPS